MRAICKAIKSKISSALHICLCIVKTLSKRTGQIENAYTSKCLYHIRKYYLYFEQKQNAHTNFNAIV